jgi:hypothetical protein
MKLNRTREEWARLLAISRKEIGGGLDALSETALEDLATLHAEVELLRGALALISFKTDMTRENWTGLRGGDIELLHEIAREALGNTHD